jgi:hypothetical protein
MTDRAVRAEQRSHDPEFRIEKSRSELPLCADRYDNRQFVRTTYAA